MDINEELDQFLELQKPQALEAGAESKKLQAGAAAPTLPQAPIVPVQAPETKPQVNVSSSAANELDQFLELSNEEPKATNELDAFLELDQEQSEPGYGELLTGSVARGAAQVASAPVDIAGMAAEFSGNDAVAQEAYDKARLIESYAPKARYTWENIYDPDSLARWMIERTGEQAPVMAALFTGGGAAALGGRLVGSAILRNPRAIAKATELGFAAGGAAVGVGLETAGAGSEFKERTGSYNPERAAAVGVANGLLEFYGPFKLFKGLNSPSSSIVATGLKTAGREALTEVAQELNTAANAAAVDEKYDFFTRETFVRVVEAGLAGGVVGGVYGAGAQAAAGSVKAEGEKPGTERTLSEAEINRLPEETTPVFNDPNTWENAVTYLRSKMLRRAALDNFDTSLSQKGFNDVAEAGTFFEDVKRGWAAEGILASQITEVANFQDSLTKRFVWQRADGTWSDALTDVDLELDLLDAPQGVQPQLYEVDLKSLAPGGITAHPFDLPLSADDKRIYFAPWVRQEEKATLLATYQQMTQAIQEAHTIKLQGNTKQRKQAAATIMEFYAPLANKGLRIIPSAGASFAYKGELEGKPVQNSADIKSMRSWQVALLPQNVTELMPGTVLQTPKLGVREGNNFPSLPNWGPEQQGFSVVALDFNKLEFEDSFGFDDYVAHFSRETLESLVHYRKGLTTEQKAALFDELYASLRDAVLFPTLVQTRLRRMHKKGIAIRPEATEQVELVRGGDKLLPKTTPGTFSPGQVGASSTLQAELKSRGTFKYKDDVLRTYGGKLTKREQQVKDKIEPILKDVIKLLGEVWSEAKLPGGINMALYYEMSHNPGIADYTAAKIGLNLNALANSEFFKDYDVNSPLFIADVMQIILHEFGHLLTGATWYGLPANEQQLILTAYERTRLRYAVDKSALGTHVWLTSTKNEFQPVYSITFVEFMAEQLRRYIWQREFKANNKSWPAQLHKAMQALEDKFIKSYHYADVHRLMTPMWEITTVYDYLLAGQLEVKADTQQNAEKWQSAMVQTALRLPETIVTLETDPLYTETRKLVEAWRKALPGVDIEVERSRGPDNELATFELDPLTGRDTIRLWTGALGFSDPGALLAHEAVHAIWNKLTQAEKNTLIAAGKRSKSITGDLEKRYFNRYKKAFIKLGVNEQEAIRMARVEVDQERAAFVIQNLMTGKSFGQEADTLIKRLLELFEQIRNLLVGRGWNSPETILRKLQAGEIAARQNIRKSELAKAAYTQRAPLLTARQADINPSAILRVTPEIFAAEEIQADGMLRNYRFYQPPISGRFAGSTVIEQLEELGPEIGQISLTQKGSLGFEVDWVEINSNFTFKVSKVDYSDQLYTWLGKHLKQPMRPSGVLSQQGYSMWKRRNPASVQWHVFNEVNKFWYSPKTLLRHLESAKLELEQEAAKKPNVPRNRLFSYTRVAVTERLLSKVDQKAFEDPDYAISFATQPFNSRISNELMLGALEAEGFIISNQYTKAISGEAAGPVEDPFMKDHQNKLNASQAANAKALGVSFEMAAPEQPELRVVRAALRKYGEHNPDVARELSGRSLLAEGDRIGKFTKMFLSIKQLAWRNPHINALREYVGFKDEMNSMRMQWISRADETIRAWDNLQLAGQRDKLSDLLFWATEMDYLKPGESTRQPTMVELQGYAKANGLSNETMQLYFNIQKDFYDYLDAVEVVLTENIQRENSIIVNGVLQLSQAGQAALAELSADIKAMKTKPYFPMVRFGEYSLSVRDPGANNEVVWFSTYATPGERDAAVKSVAKLHPGGRVQIGVVLPEVMEFQGLPAPIIKALLAEPSFGLTEQQRDWLKKFALQMAPEKSFKKRWLKRKGTPGYSLDGMRTYASYFQGASSYLAKLKYKPILQERINELKSSNKDYMDSEKRAHLVRFIEADLKYSMEPSRDWHKFRAAVSIWQLGLSPAAAIVNLTQTPMFTMPYFAGLYGQSTVFRLLLQIIKSTKRAATYNPTKATAEFAAARQMLVQMGKLETGAAPELGAYAEGGNLLGLAAGTKAQRAFRSFSRGTMVMFQAAEKVNREIVLGASWELSADSNHYHYKDVEKQYALEILNLTQQTVEVNGQQLPISWDTAVRIIMAREAISRTQFEYGRDYRPPFLRSPLASSFLVFFGYVQSALFAMGNNPGALQTFLIMAFLFGAMGLPFAEDLDEVLNAIARALFGKDFSLEAKAREFVRELTRGTVFDEVGPDLFLHGVSRYSFGPGLLQEGLGIPQFDASTNGSMGRIVPGLAETARAVGRGDDWKSITGELSRDLAGAGFGQIFPMLQFLASDFPSTDQKKWEKVMPRAVKAVSKSIRYSVEGEERTNQGGTFHEFNLTDPDDIATIVAQGLGFTPTAISQKWDFVTTAGDTLKFYQARKASLMLQMDKAVQAKNPEVKATVISAIKRYNEEVNSLGIAGLGITMDGLKQSMKQRALARRRQELNVPQVRGATKLYQKLLDQYPGVEEVK